MFTKSESITSLAPALVAALGEMTDVKKGRKAKVPTKAGGSYEYSYADLADTIQSVRPVLAKHGLAVVQNASTANPDYVLISTTLVHASGEWMTFEPLAMPAGRSAQESGSAISYGRRYHLLAALGLAAEDDDGASARGRQTRPVAPRGRDDDQASPSPRRAPQAPQGHRTEAERAIRETLATMGPAAGAVKARFIERYGRLADLDPAHHDDALAWLGMAIRDNESE